MRYQTHKRIEKAYDRLPMDHEFESREHFCTIAAGLGEVSGDGSHFFYSRRHDDRPYGPDNISLVEIVVDSCWDRVFHPVV